MSKSSMLSACEALQIAAKRGRPSDVDAAAAKIEGRNIAPGHIDALVIAIGYCKPSAAKAMADFLRKPDVADEIAHQIYFHRKRPAKLRIKTLSALTAAGADPDLMKPLMQNEDHDTRQHLSKLRGVGGSHHAKMAVFKLDPDLESILARPLRGSFHGTKHKVDFKSAMKKWFREQQRTIVLAGYFGCSSIIASAMFTSRMNPDVTFYPAFPLILLGGFTVAAATYLISRALDGFR